MEEEVAWETSALRMVWQALLFWICFWLDFIWAEFWESRFRALVRLVGFRLFWRRVEEKPFEAK